MHESTPFDTANYINKLQNQLAYIKNIYTIERSDVVDFQRWLHSPEQTVAYLDIEGTSPTITNHLSDVTYKIQGGEGRMLTNHP